MKSLTDALHNELDQVLSTDSPLDHDDLQRRGHRQRYVRGTAAGLGAAASIAAVAVVITGLTPSAPTSLEVLGSPAGPEPDDVAAGDTAVTESFEDWYERKAGNVQEAIEHAPQPQHDALADAVVTPDELATARQAFSDCMQDAGHDITVNTDGSYDIEGDQSAQLDRDDARCWDTHLSAIAPAWEWQELDHRAAWREWQDRLTDLPEDLGPPEDMEEIGS